MQRAYTSCLYRLHIYKLKKKLLVRVVKTEFLVRTLGTNIVSIYLRSAASLRSSLLALEHTEA
jgi:hypothetical protein